MTVREILGRENGTTTGSCLHTVSGSAQEAIQVCEQVMVKSHSDSHSKRKGLLRLIGNPNLNS